MQRVLITSTNEWDYQKKDGSGRSVGATIEYYTGEAKAVDQGKGLARLESRIDPELAKRELSQVPGVYDVEFRLTPDRFNRGAVQIVVEALTFVGAVDLVKVLVNEHGEVGKPGRPVAANGALAGAGAGR